MVRGTFYLSVSLKLSYQAQFSHCLRYSDLNNIRSLNDSFY